MYFINKDVYVAFNASEITSLKYPPTSVNLVAEAFCLLFSMKPSFSTFQSIITYEPDFLHKYIRPFNPSSVSDYVLNELTTYLENPDFQNTDLVNKTASALGKWILVVYEIACSNNPKDFKVRKIILNRFFFYI